MGASITGIGQWFPPTVRTNEAWSSDFALQAAKRLGDRTLLDIPSGDADRCQKIASAYLEAEARDPFVGTTERRVSSEGTTASDAEAHAARAALEDASVDPADVDVILSWAIVPDRLTPSNACRVGDAIGAKGAWSMSVDAACASVVTQLVIGASMIECGRATTVLLTQSHWVTRAMPMDHPASPNVGDGAAAMVVQATADPGILATVARTHGEYYDAVTWCRGKTPQTDPPWWEPGGSFYLGSLDSKAAQYLVLNTVRAGSNTLDELMKKADRPAHAIDVLACVQPRRWVPAAIAEAVDLNASVAPQTFDRYAHLGGVGVVTNLIAARNAGMLAPGACVALYAQGAGFTRAAALLKWAAT